MRNRATRSAGFECRHKDTHTGTGAGKDNDNDKAKAKNIDTNMNAIM